MSSINLAQMRRVLATGGVNQDFPVDTSDLIENSQVWSTGTAAPGSAAHVKGEIVWNTNPTPTGYIGFVCTTAGTPGTWKGFGVIQA